MTKVTTKWLALVGVFLVAVAVGFANTAADLQLERSHLYKKMKSLGIERK